MTLETLSLSLRAILFITSKQGMILRGTRTFQRLTFLESKIKLMLNPNEEDHQKLEWMIHEMMQALERGDEKGRQDFIATHPEVIKLSRLVFKREWNRVKDNIELATVSIVEKARLAADQS